jgi:hypothetical protein
MDGRREATARRLEFGEGDSGVAVSGRRRTKLRLASSLDLWHGPDKYRVLDLRRRRAHIRARRALGL